LASLLVQSAASTGIDPPHKIRKSEPEENFFDGSYYAEIGRARPDSPVAEISELLFSTK
jgi:hypothetical protein